MMITEPMKTLRVQKRLFSRNKTTYQKHLLCKKKTQSTPTKLDIAGHITELLLLQMRFTR